MENCLYSSFTFPPFQGCLKYSIIENSNHRRFDENSEVAVRTSLVEIIGSMRHTKYVCILINWTSNTAPTWEIRLVTLPETRTREYCICSALDTLSKICSIGQEKLLIQFLTLIYQQRIKRKLLGDFCRITRWHHLFQEWAGMTAATAGGQHGRELGWQLSQMLHFWVSVFKKTRITKRILDSSLLQDSSPYELAWPAPNAPRPALSVTCVAPAAVTRHNASHSSCRLTCCGHDLRSVTDGWLLMTDCTTCNGDC